MPDNVNPNSQQPDNRRTSADATVAASPVEPGTGKLEELEMFKPQEHPWPASFGRPEFPSPSAAAAAQKITAGTGFQTVVRDGGERGDVDDARVVEVFPEGKRDARWGGPWTRNASDEKKTR